MREIKFRAWNKAQKRWATHGELLDVVPVSANILAPCAITIGKEDSEWVFVQFTGLKDKNGKEIYEGDILEFTDSYSGEHTGRVSWSPSGYWSYDSNESEDGGLLGKFLNTDSFEVVGNIHENPAILHGQV